MRQQSHSASSRKKPQTRRRSHMARISPASDAIIDEIAAKTGKSKIEIIDEALEAYSFQERMRVLNDEFERLRSDEQKWKQELEERNELEGTLSDGLE